MGSFFFASASFFAECSAFRRDFSSRLSGLPAGPASASLGGGSSSLPNCSLESLAGFHPRCCQDANRGWICLDDPCRQRPAPVAPLRISAHTLCRADSVLCLWEKPVRMRQTAADPGAPPQGAYLIDRPRSGWAAHQGVSRRCSPSRSNRKRVLHGGASDRGALSASCTGESIPPCVSVWNCRW